MTGRTKVRADTAWAVARDLELRLWGRCERIEVVGSLRRRKQWVGDIEFLCIPMYEGWKNLLDERVRDLIADGILDYRLNKLGSKVYGRWNKLLVHVASGIGVDIFSTDGHRWAVALVVRTGGEATNKEIATRAIQRGLRFHAYGSGFTREDGREIVCQTEAEVFAAVGLPWREPWERA